MRCAVLLSLLLALPLHAAELARLTNANWERFAPDGKEADCILGDYAFRSDRLMIVVAQPLPTRHANLTVRQVGGAVIDLTTLERQNDQLSAFYPGRRLQVFNEAVIVQGKGSKIVLKCSAPAQPADVEKKKSAQPAVQVFYELEDGKAFLLVRSVFTNTLPGPLTLTLEDDLRLDDVETRSPGGASDLFWSHDKHFEQAYALLPEGCQIHTRSTLRESVIQYLMPDGKSEIELKPGQSHTLVRRLFPGPHLLAVKGEVAKHRNEPTTSYGWRLVDPQLKPVVAGEVILKNGERTYGTGRSDEQGWVKAALPLEKFSLTCKSIGRPALTTELDLTQAKKDEVYHAQLNLEKASAVEAVVTDEKGGPIPCKVAFKGIGETQSPNWGPPGARAGVVNLFYSANGKFTVPIQPGQYEATITYGPEYDLVRVPLMVEKGKRTPLRAKLRRAYDTPGWVSADFHSHSSPSGDNTGDQRGRVLNLLGEHIEFAPCTEHNRIDSYEPHLKALNARHLLGTCSGIELTGTPLPLNHHNAFPLEWHPRTQDGGAPVVDVDPQVQIRRLAEWGNPEILKKGERLVQQNHPDVGWLFFDKDGDGKPDGGYKAGFPYMHVIEVHPIHEVLEMQPTRIVTNLREKKSYRFNNSIFCWLQLLNQGYRIPGVVNTDAHYNFHGSGGLRIWVRSDAKVAGDIDPLEIVRHSRKGHIIMSTGPYLEVKLGSVLPGDDVSLKSGKGELEVTACCPNWFDIDRVQVLVNGRPDPKLNFTRASHPKFFAKTGVVFQQRVPFQLDRDAHLIVVAAGDVEIGEVMGAQWGRQRPVAISNPIYVDVDGNGFQPNRDTLGQPLPVKSLQEVK